MQAIDDFDQHSLLGTLDAEFQETDLTHEKGDVQWVTEKSPDS